MKPIIVLECQFWCLLKALWLLHVMHCITQNCQNRLIVDSVLQALTLDCGNHWPGGPVNQKIHWPPQKPTGPPKTCNDPNVFAAGIYDFTSEVAHFCTLGLYITKNKYELTLPSEFCQFPVKIMAAYEALKKQNKKTLAPQASGK